MTVSVILGPPDDPSDGDDVNPWSPLVSDDDEPPPLVSSTLESSAHSESSADSSDFDVFEDLARLINFNKGKGKGKDKGTDGKGKPGKPSK